ncbi:Glycosyl hydrolase family 32 domain-containing protein [Cladophialophora immunda]|nr:Glycosyl hydrolase family 32 domain-containing protein [Cladophialophora immunda]
MVNWNLSQTPIVEPGLSADEWYDANGCFTGCLVPANLDGQSGAGQLTVLYTGISRLPLHYTLPYVRRTETLAAAQSLDGGLGWTKVTKNPILPEPPPDLDVTGWRDPFVATWPSMAKLLGDDKNQLYGMISGGIRNCSPTAFLYKVNPSNLTEWKYLSPLFDVGLSHSLSSWSGDMGINWECACFMTLQNEQDDESRDFVVVGCEGSKANTADHELSLFTQHPQEPTKPPRSATSLQWMCGALQSTDVMISDTGTQTKLPKMNYQFGGRFDFGLLYAATTFRDPLGDKQVVWGWITEEDLPQALVDKQGWSGMVSLPREVTLLTLKGVTGTLRSRLQNITSIEVEREESTDREQQTFKIRTLGISPAPCIQSLRNSARKVSPTSHSQGLNPEGDTFMDIQTHRFEFISTLSLSRACKRIGLSIFHTAGAQRTQQNNMAPRLSSNAATTTISFIPSKETIRIDRPVTDSTHIIDGEKINTAPEIAPFTLFTLLPADEDDVQHIAAEAETNTQTGIENLQIHVFFDESVLEVFVNSRCVITTRIYPPGKRCFGVRFWAEDEVEHEDENEGKDDDRKGHHEEKETQKSSAAQQWQQQRGERRINLEGEGVRIQRESKTTRSSKSRLLHAMAWDGLRADLRASLLDSA